MKVSELIRHLETLPRDAELTALAPSFMTKEDDDGRYFKTLKLDFDSPNHIIYLYGIPNYSGFDHGETVKTFY